MELCLILEDWLLQRGMFLTLCENKLHDCESRDCPKVFRSSDGSESPAKFLDFLKFLSEIGYSGECFSAIRLDEEDNPRSAELPYRLYFIRRGEEFPDRASKVIRGIWSTPRFPVPGCPTAYTASARFG